MGTYMKTFAQRRAGDGEWVDLDYKPFDWQSYGMFGFLADVRNHSQAPVISEPRGWPSDFWGVQPEIDNAGLPFGHRYYDDPYGADHFSKSWFTLEELIAYDYDQVFEDMRPSTDDPPRPTLREFLGDYYFADLDRLKAFGAERIMVVFS